MPIVLVVQKLQVVLEMGSLNNKQVEDLSLTSFLIPQVTRFFLVVLMAIPIEVFLYGAMGPGVWDLETLLQTPRLVGSLVLAGSFKLRLLQGSLQH